MQVLGDVADGNSHLRNAANVVDQSTVPLVMHVLRDMLDVIPQHFGRNFTPDIHDRRPQRSIVNPAKFRKKLLNVSGA